MDHNGRLETKTETILQFMNGLRGGLQVTFEERAWASGLHDTRTGTRLPGDHSESHARDDTEKRSIRVGGFSVPASGLCASAPSGMARGAGGRSHRLPD